MDWVLVVAVCSAEVLILGEVVETEFWLRGADARYVSIAE